MFLNLSQQSLRRRILLIEGHGRALLQEQRGLGNGMRWARSVVREDLSDGVAEENGDVGKFRGV